MFIEWLDLITATIAVFFIGVFIGLVSYLIFIEK